MNLLTGRKNWHRANKSRLFTWVCGKHREDGGINRINYRKPKDRKKTKRDYNLQYWTLAKDNAKQIENIIN